VGTVAHPASIGVTPKEYLDKMLAEPFESFTFSPAGAAVYQLGPRIYVARPNRPVVGADWGMRFAVTLLFPK